MSLKTFFLDRGAIPQSPTYEVNGPLNKGDPVHENLTLLTLKEAIEQVQSKQLSRAGETLLSGIKLAELPQWNSKKHHDFNPRKAPESTQEFLRGVYWPDDPKCYFFRDVRGTKNYTTGYRWFKEFSKGKHGKIKTADQLIARSHFGDLQFFHAMASRLNEPANETRENILLWARFNVAVALGRIPPGTQLKDLNAKDEKLSKLQCFFKSSAYWNWTIKELLTGGEKRGKSLDEVFEDVHVRHRATGVLLHLIQDSFAAGHVERDESRAIRQFHDYASQDSHDHGRQDKMGRGELLSQHIDNTPGARQAIDAGARLVVLLDSDGSVDDVMKYFEEIFKLSTDVRGAGPGEDFKDGGRAGARSGLKGATVVAKAMFFRTGRKSPEAVNPGFNACGSQRASDVPGAWRGGSTSDVGKVIAKTLDRMRRSEYANLKIMGETIESLFARAILDNQYVTNQQIIQISEVTFERIKAGQGTSDEDREWVLKKTHGKARDVPVHKFTVALMAAATNHVNENGMEKAFSMEFPDLGVTGAINTPLMMIAKTPRVQLSTALHDFTDYMRNAGVVGLNKAVWGIEDRILSAFVSVRGEGRY